MAFADPLAFLFAALLGVLVLFYLWERRRQRVVLPSLLLWEQVRDDRITASRFRPDLLFYLQALALLLLILGLAKPYWRSGAVLPAGRRHIVVLDTTASMQTRESQTTRFATAQAEAAQLIDGFADDDEVMLLAAGRAASVLVEFTRDRAALHRALAQAAPIDAGGELSAALAFADSLRQRGQQATDIFAFTDIPRSQLPAAQRDQVTVFQVGERHDNVAIESLQIQQGRFQGHEGASAYVQVRNYAAREVHSLLSLQVEDVVVERNGLTLAPLESRRVLVSGFPRAGKVSATLEPADALALDNTAYGWIRESSALRILLVSKASALVNDLRKLAPASRLRLRVVDPSTFTPASIHDSDVVIFHRFAPDPPDGINALYIFPPSQGLFPSTGEATDLEVIDWNAEHAALRSLQPLAALPLARARIVTPPEGSDILLRTRTQQHEFPLAFARELVGQRLACLTFDLEAERILHSDSTSVLLFLLNLLDWLAPQNNQTQVVRTGEATSLRGLPAPLRIVDPRGQTIAVDGDAPIIEPLVAGAYVLQAGDEKRVLLANFSDPQESNIGRAVVQSEPAAAATPQTAESEALRRVVAPAGGFGTWLWFLAALLLILEWVVAARRAGARS